MDRFLWIKKSDDSHSKPKFRLKVLNFYILITALTTLMIGAYQIDNLIVHISAIFFSIAIFIWNSLNAAIRIENLSENTKTLKDSENLALSNLNLALDAASMGTFEWDVVNDVHHWSNQTAQLFGFEPGYRPANIDALMSQIFPEDVDQIWTAFNRAVDANVTYSVEYRIVKPNGEQAWISARGAVIKDPQGKPIQLRGTVININEKKIAEDTLSKWRSIFDNGGWGISIANPDNTFIEVNKAFAKMHGTTPEFWIGRHLSEMFHEESRHALPGLAKLVEDKGSIVYDSMHIRSDGTAFPVQTEVTAFYDNKKKLLYRAALFQDISERKAFERAVADSEFKFRQLAEGVPQLIWISNREGKIEYYNSRWIEYTGFGDGAEVTWEDVVYPDDIAEASKAWNQSLASGDEFKATYRLKRKSDGTFRWHDSHAISLRDEKGQVFRWIGTCTDIHELHQTRDELKHALHTREEFLSLASHELKTPLTSLRLQADLLLHGVATQSETLLSREKIEMVARNTDWQVTRLTRLVNDMLDYSRVSDGRLSLYSERFDLDLTVRECLEKAKPEYLKEHIPPPQLESCGPVIGVWDRMRIEQIINNLLSNALRYGNRMPVRIILKQDSKRAWIECIDQGIGIQDNHHSRIFDRFYRAAGDGEHNGLGA